MDLYYSANNPSFDLTLLIFVNSYFYSFVRLFNSNKIYGVYVILSSTKYGFHTNSLSKFNS